MGRQLPEGLYIVEDVLDKRTRYRRDEYLIKWEGYESFDNTWEPKEHISEPMLLSMNGNEWLKFKLMFMTDGAVGKSVEIIKNRYKSDIESKYAGTKKNNKINECITKAKEKPKSQISSKLKKNNLLKHKKRINKTTKMTKKLQSEYEIEKFYIQRLKNGSIQCFLQWVMHGSCHKCNKNTNFHTMIDEFKIEWLKIKLLAAFSESTSSVDLENKNIELEGVDEEIEMLKKSLIQLHIFECECDSAKDEDMTHVSIVTWETANILTIRLYSPRLLIVLETGMKICNFPTQNDNNEEQE